MNSLNLFLSFLFIPGNSCFINEKHSKKGFISTSFDQEKRHCCDGGIGCFVKEGIYAHFPLPYCPNQNNTFFILYTEVDNGTLIRSDRVVLPNTIKKDNPLIIYIHGYQGSSDGPNARYFREKLFQTMNVNLITVDWSSISKTLDYKIGASSTQTVGKFIAMNLIDPLVKNHDFISYNDIWCIGFSLGAHVCGVAGLNTKAKIKRITGLDPAGPSFTSQDPTIRLSKQSAKYVDAYHTNALNKFKVNLGIKEPVGHSDFYMNGATSQPGCSSFSSLFSSSIHKYVGCSHRRAIVYFLETLSNPCCHVGSLKCSYLEGQLVDCNDCEEGTFAYAGIRAPNSTCGENHGYEGVFLIQTRKHTLNEKFCTISKNCIFE